MYEYIFLFSIAAIWTIFAVVQDIRFTEISDWLTFSLLVICLGYRAIYSFYSGDMSFFLSGVGGTLLFLVLSYVFYYGGFFAGGDAKLLVSFGAVLPFEKIFDYVSYGGGFVFLLFFVGAIYSLIMSAFFTFRKFSVFKKGFSRNLATYKFGIYVVLALSVLLFMFSGWMFIGVLTMGILFLYLRTVDEYCMAALLSPNKLREGDWIVEDVKVGRNIIKKTVHGLTKEDIDFLIKHKKSVIVKNGIPFAPCFLIAFGIMVFFFLELVDFSQVIAYFSSFFLLF